MASAFPPFEEHTAAWVAVVPLLFIARFSNPKTAFKSGFLAGLIFWLLSISWLLRLAETGGPLPLVILGWILLAGYCAVYIAAFTMVVASLFDAHGPDTHWKPTAEILWNTGILVTVPLLWVGFEYLRCTLFTGFPWNALGISQFRNLPIIQVAEWGGVYAVSAMIILMNTALAMTAFRFTPAYRRQAGARAGLTVAMLVCMLCWLHGLRRVEQLLRGPDAGTSTRVAAVQPNIRQLKKWPVMYHLEVCDRLSELTNLALMGNPGLVVWPETAVPATFGRDRDAAEFVRRLALGRAPILAGVMEAELVDGRWRYYNSSFLFGVDGNVHGKYRKRHLVPFGEYLPLDKRFRFIEELAPLGYSCTAGASSTVFRLAGSDSETNGTVNTSSPAGGIAFSVLICFEDTFAPLAARSVRNGARLLVNQTNDAWFDGSSAARQHMSHCVLRAVENRVPCVRVANTGVTCFIDQTGRIQGTDLLEREDWGMCVPRFETSQMLVPPNDMPLTFYTRHADLPFALPCGILSAAAIMLTVVRILFGKETRVV